MKQKKYYFEATQTIVNKGTFSIEASSLKDAEEKILNMKKNGIGKTYEMVDWYFGTEDFSQMVENSELHFELVDK
jgi:hypothetical protein